MDKKTEKILRTIIHTCVFVLPITVLIVSPWLFFPYITGKNFAFRVLVEIMLGAYIPLAVLAPKYRPRRSALVMSLAVFVSIVALADIFGANPFHSFWSNFERMDGFVTLAHMATFALIAGSVLSVSKWLTFWRVSIASSAIVAIAALWQAVSTGKARLDAILGNPIYLAVYMLFHIFIMLFLLTRDGVRTAERRLYGVLILVEMLTLFLTATRGAAIGLIVGATVVALGIALTKTADTVHRRIAVWVLAALVVFAGIFMLAKNTTFVQEHRTLARFANISLSSDTVETRFLVWRIAWHGFQEHSVLGWGQGNFDLPYAKYFEPGLSDAEEWYDRAHNMVFDWLIAAGSLGLLAYLALYMAAFYILYRLMGITPTQKWVVVGLLVAYGIQNLTVFDTVVSYILFFAILAFLHTLSRTEAHTPEHTESSYTLAAPIIGVIVLVCAGTAIYSINATPYTTNKMLIQALAATGIAQPDIQSNPQQSAEALTVAFNLYTQASLRHGYGLVEVRERFAKAAMQVAMMPVTDEIKQQWIIGSAQALSDSIEDAPNDPRPVVQIGLLYEAYGLREPALQAYMRADELAPNKPINLLRIGAILVTLGYAEEALAYMESAYDLAPEYENARVFYAVALLISGNKTLAQDIIDVEPSIADDPRIQKALGQ